MAEEDNDKGEENKEEDLSSRCREGGAVKNV